MPNASAPLESVRWTRVFPVLYLGRAFWIAADVRKLVLAAVGLLLSSAGLMLIERLNLSGAEERRESAAATRWPWEHQLGYRLPHGTTPLTELDVVLADPWPVIAAVIGNWQLPLLPVRTILEPARVLMQPAATWGELLDGIGRFLWLVLVWSVFGVAITRSAAVQFARDQTVSLRQALAFSGKHLLDSLSAPLLPFSGVLALGGMLALGGLLGRIPGAGAWIVGALWGLALLTGLLMLVITVGLAVGWPLMFATLSVEGTDGFDGLSRAYNYVYERPWHYFVGMVLAAALGSVAIFAVWLGACLVQHFARCSVAWGVGVELQPAIVGLELPLSGSLPVSVDPAGAGAAGATLLYRLWTGALATVVMAYVWSYFWTAAVILYFLLRRSIDGNPLDEVHMETASEADDLLPLVGTAAMTTPVPPGAIETSGPPPIDLTP